MAAQTRNNSGEMAAVCACLGRVMAIGESYGRACARSKV